MCQCKFIPDKKCAILVSDVDNGGAYSCVGAGSYGKSLYFPFNVVEYLKLL